MRTAWKTPVAYLLALFPAAVLIIAAFLKAADPAMFAEQISAHKVTPAAWSPFLAYFFIAAELGLGVALISFVRPRETFALTILLMLGFIGVTALAWAHGYRGDCGCYGRVLNRLPRDVIIEDALIVIACLAGLWLVRGYHARSWQWAVFAVLLVPVLLLIAFGTALPVDGMVVGIGRGDKLGDLPLEGLRVPLDEGLVLVALVADDCSACERGLPALKEIAAGASPRVVAACPGGPNVSQAWRLSHLPNFAVASSPEKVLRRYYRRLPTTLLLDNGIVQKVWWNRIPTAAEVGRIAGQAGDASQP